MRSTAYFSCRLKGLSALGLCQRMSASTEWLEAYEKCANSVAAHPSPHTRPALKASVKDLDERLVLLEQAPNKAGLDKKELARRRALVSDLQVQTRPVMGGGSFVRPDDKSSAGSPAGSRDGMQLGSLQSKQMMAEQDLILGEVGAGVDRLHERAVNIHDETKLHVRLLSDIDYDVEKAMGGLKTETKHAMETRKKTGNCHLYVCIVVLLIVLVLLLVLSS